jgi:hypothetical protein
MPFRACLPVAKIIFHPLNWLKIEIRFSLLSGENLGLFVTRFSQTLFDEKWSETGNSSGPLFDIFHLTQLCELPSPF